MDPRLSEAGVPEERLHRARLVAITLRLAVPALAAGAALAAVAGYRAAGGVAAATLVALAATGLARRGRHQAAALVLSVTMLILATWLLYVGDGLQDVAVLLYPVVVLVAGLIVDTGPFALLAGAAILSLGGIAFGQAHGFVQVLGDRHAAIPYDFVLAALLVGVAATIAHLLVGDLRASLRQLWESERALRGSEQTFNAAFRSSPAVMVIVNLDEGTYQDVNEAFTRVTGLSREEVAGRPLDAVDVWVDHAERDAMRATLRAEGSLSEVPMRFRRKSGEEVIGLVSAEVVELNGVRCGLWTASDVTARWRAEAALARSEERYRLITQVISDYTFSSVVDLEGRVQQDWVAGAFEAITGYEFDEYMARGGWRAALHPDDLEKDDQDLLTLRARRRVDSELRTITRDGSVRWVRVSAHPVWGEEEDRLVGIYGAVEDITDRKRDEAQRETLIRELEAKNSELERFTYTVSHDLQSPLVTVSGFAGLLEKEAREGNLDSLEDNIRRINDATAKMQRLLDELLELSRVGRMVSPPVEVPFEEIVREALGLVAGRIAERGVAVEVARGLPRVHCDRLRVLQVVQNLVDNAVKFMGEQDRPRIEIGARQEADGTVLYVADNGMGVEDRHRDRIFGLFEKLDPAVPGTGVGLALVRRVVELHGGRCWVESDGPGRGATFCFTLPPPNDPVRPPRPL